jgi:hypothetical protein
LDPRAGYYPQVYTPYPSEKPVIVYNSIPYPVQPVIQHNNYNQSYGSQIQPEEEINTNVQES